MNSKQRYVAVEEKKCSQCKKTKEVTCFNKNKTRKDGLCNICKQCRKKYYIKNKHIIDSKSKKYDLENKEKKKLYRKKRHKITKNNRIMISLKQYNLLTVEEKLKDTIFFLIKARELNKKIKQYEEFKK